MSKSYRRPYSSCAGKNVSSKRDKQIASRSVRRAFKQSLITCLDFEDYTPPHYLECAHNDPYGWSRDCSRYKTYHYFPDRYDMNALERYGLDDFERRREYFESLKRK